MDRILLSRLAAGENETTEFKTKVSPGSAARVVCSFLNADGGSLFCGVGDDGNVVGIGPEPQKMADRLELFLKQTISPTPFLTVSVSTVEDRQIIVVDAPQGHDGPYVFEGGVWLRSGPTTRAADVSALRALLRTNVETERWERQISPLLTDDELDIDEIRAAVRDAGNNNRFPFTDPSETRLVLKDLSMLTAAGFTNAGDALFSRSPGRRHPQCRVQLVAYANDKLDDVYADNRWFEGPLIRVCAELISAVTAASPTSSQFSAHDIQRVDRPAYDVRALREGIVNAFVHRDYSAYSGGLKVSIYRDRIEIWNSGSLPEGLKPSDLRRDHSSILVNPDIAQIFYLRGLMERLGRGTEFIARASKRLGASAPLWRDTPTGVTLTIFSAHGDRTPRSVFNHRQSGLLDKLDVGDTIAPRDYGRTFGSSVTDRQARRDLDELVKAGILVIEGAGPSTVYRRKA